MEKKIIELLKDKDHKGLELLIENYSGLLHSVVSRVLVKKPHLRGEVLNDSLLAIWENIDSYDPSRSSFKNWAASVARYKSIDSLRKEIKHNSVELHPEILHLDSDIGYNKVLIQEIFDCLEEEDRKLFVKIFLQGYTYDEISEELEVSKNALYSRVKRGRQKLKEEFKG